MKWGESELAYIRANAGVLTDEEIAYRLTLITGQPVTTAAARCQRQAMGLRKKRGRGVCRLEDDARPWAERAMSTRACRPAKP